MNERANERMAASVMSAVATSSVTVVMIGAGGGLVQIRALPSCDRCF